MINLSVVIVNWNVKDLIQKCLESIFYYTQELNFEVIVVDNNSYDGSVQFLKKIKKRYQNLKVIFNDSNRGFSVANNQGLKIAKGKYVIFLNPDTELEENSFKKLYIFMEKNSNVGACTCRLLYGDRTLQPNVKRDPCFFSQLLILLKLHHFFKFKSLKKYLAKDFDYLSLKEVEQIMGAFIFTRKDLMERLGGWSEDYFIWWEDVDLCFRIRKSGYKIIYYPFTKIIHWEGKSFSQQQSLQKQKKFNQGMLIYWKKYHPYWQSIILMLIFPISILLAGAVQLFGIKPKTQSQI